MARLVHLVHLRMLTKCDGEILREKRGSSKWPLAMALRSTRLLLIYDLLSGSPRGLWSLTRGSCSPCSPCQRDVPLIKATSTLIKAVLAESQSSYPGSPLLLQEPLKSIKMRPKELRTRELAHFLIQLLFYLEYKLSSRWINHCLKMTYFTFLDQYQQSSETETKLSSFVKEIISVW